MDNDRIPPPPAFALGRGTQVHVESAPRRTACGAELVARSTRRPSGPMCPTCAGYRAAAFGRLITAEHKVTASRARVRVEATVDGIALAGSSGAATLLVEDAAALADALAVRLAARQEADRLREARREVVAQRMQSLCAHGLRSGACEEPDCTSHSANAGPYRPGEGPRRAD